MFIIDFSATRNSVSALFKTYITIPQNFDDSLCIHEKNVLFSGAMVASKMLRINHRKNGRYFLLILSEV